MENRKQEKTISVLIKPASSLCNLRCRYCFYTDISENRAAPSRGIMTQETTALLCERINEALEGTGIANISFQGGEPTAAGLSFFNHFTETMKAYPGIRVNYSLQTNGTLITEEWADFFHEYNFLIGISLDGYQKNTDYFRQDTDNKGVYWQILNTADLLKKKNVEFNILTVVTRQLAEHPKALYQFYRDHKFRYVQLIPCLPSLQSKDDPYALTPETYASFYNGFFDAWVAGVRKGFSMSVNLFDNLYEMLRGRMPYQCGMIGRCTTQFVIEADGDVYPCDFYCLDEHLLGNLKENSFRELAENEQARSFLKGSACTKKPCLQCRYRTLCNGGCRRQNVCWLNQDYCAYQSVLDHILPMLSSMHH